MKQYKGLCAALLVLTFLFLFLAPASGLVIPARAENMSVDAVMSEYQSLKNGSPGFFSVPFYSALEAIVILVLKAILSVAGMLLSAAKTIFTWVVKVDNMELMINGPKLYDSWKIIRDLLNIFFILILVYTAFTIIFQVDSTNKKVILTLVIMALLVNFSFPITRFIIDLSNSLMYTILNSLSFGGGSGADALGTITAKTGIEKILHPDQVSVSSLIAAIIFVIMYAVTILVTAVLFIVRMIALAILIIFSPVAFVASILPSTSNYASKWWNNLFRYAFFGPIMVLMLFVTAQLMAGFSDQNALQNFYAEAGRETFSPNIIASIAYLSIPIVLLWMGIGIGQTMSIAGADAVVNRARKSLNWFFTRASGAHFIADTFRAYRARREQAKEDNWSRKLGTQLGSKQDQLRGMIPIGGRDAQLRYERDIAAKIKKESERNDTANMATNELRNIVNQEDKLGNKKFTKAAAMQELASRGQATQTDLDYMRTTFGDTSQAFRQLQAKVKTYDPVAAFNHLVDPATKDTTLRDQRIQEFVNSNQFDLKKINSNSLRDADFVETLYDNNAISMKDIMELRKDTGKDAALTSSLSRIVDHRNAHQSETDRKIQLAYMAQTGKRSAAASGVEWVNAIYSRADKDVLHRLDKSQAAIDKGYIVDNINPGKFKEAMMEMRDSGIRDDILKHARMYVTSTSSKVAKSNKRTAENDPQLKNI